MAKRSEILQGTEKEFMEVFKQLCYSRSSWQVWADVMSAIACSLSNAVDKTPGRYEAREKEYEQCIERLGSVEVPAKMLAIIVEALERNPEQDFLGAMYMQLNLGNHWKGQFFTPYCVCKMMSEITCEDVDRHIEKQGYLSICDPACGAGATLIAAANTMKKCKHNFQNQIWTWRRLFHSMSSLGGTETTEKTVEKERFYMFFDLDKKEEAYGNR